MASLNHLFQLFLMANGNAFRENGGGVLYVLQVFFDAMYVLFIICYRLLRLNFNLLALWPCLMILNRYSGS